MSIKKGSTPHWSHPILVLSDCCIVLLCLLTFSNTTSAQAKQEDRGVSVKPGASEQKVALVIGNADYPASVGKLKNPTNDATDMAAALTRLGFKLVNGKPNLNVNKRQMLDLIHEFGNHIRNGDVGVVYFAGHGVQVDKHNYLIPITDLLQYQEDAKHEAIDVDVILQQMEAAGNALNILILDACRDNHLPKQYPNRDVGKAEKGLIKPQKETPSGIYIAFAARDGQTASENPNGRNGLYTQELLKNLETPNLRIEDIFINTRREVKRLSRLFGQVQEPIEYGSLDYVFYFKPSETASVQPPLRPSPNANVHAPSLTSETGSAQPPLGPLPSAAILIPFLKGNKFGFSDASRKLVIEAKYDSADPFSEGLAGVVLNDKRGYIDKTGKEVIPFDYDDANHFSEGLASVKLYDNWGYIDETGKEVIPLKYDNADSFSEGLALVKLNGKWGYIDKTGKEVTPLKYDKALPFSEGLASMELNGKWGYIDKTSKEVIPFMYDLASSFSEGLAWVELKGKQGYIDKTGKKAIPLKYDRNIYSGWFCEGLASVELKGKQGYIDKTGKEVIPLKYDNAFPFSEGLALVNLNKKYGYIDKTGKEVIPLKYDRNIFGSSFRKGLARVKLNGKWFYIDKNGTEYYEP